MLLEGKQGLILGVANRRSIAWAIAQAMAQEGAKLAFTYQGERVRDTVRELANSLHTLELLIEEKRTATTKSIDAISREVALPVDEILQTATTIMNRWIGHEPEMAEKIVPATTAMTARRPGTRRIRRAIASMAFIATPVWNSTSPISTKNGMGVSEKFVMEATPLRTS